MKKLRKIRDKLFAAINVILSDEYFLFSYEHTADTKYNFEARSSCPAEPGLISDINYTLFQAVIASHERKAMQKNLDKAKEILK
ncbi:MAG: hypothetical protein UZ05_CHB002002162 [Chlorobi bacterium OLB5]|nr:MAG: hypothetical protein UZ05_CHB002002162 [Chlorobi bacterium OLB5]